MIKISCDNLKLMYILFNFNMFTEYLFSIILKKNNSWNEVFNVFLKYILVYTVANKCDPC